jgi:hypothetical protein
MPTQIALRFDEVPISCPAQQRYHAIAPVLAGRCGPADQAQRLHLGYSPITRRLRDFRAEGMPGLFDATRYPREPYTPERVIVTLLYFCRKIRSAIGSSRHEFGWIDLKRLAAWGLG